MVELFFMLHLDPLILYYISLLMFFNLEWAFESYLYPMQNYNCNGKIEFICEFLIRKLVKGGK